MPRNSGTATLALVAALVAAACGGDSVPLTAPTADAVAGSYALAEVNGVALVRDSTAPPGLVADTISLLPDGAVNRATYYSGQTPYLVFRSSGTYTVAGVNVTLSYKYIDGFYGAPLTPIVAGTLRGEGSVVRSMTVSSRDSVFVYATVL